MKKTMLYFAAAVAALSLAGCHPDDQPDSKDKDEKRFDHIEITLSAEYSQDILDNFDISYTVKSAGKEIVTGRMDKLKNDITINKGIDVNADADIIISAEAVSEFPVLGKEYDLDNHFNVSFDCLNKDGSSYNAGILDTNHRGGKFKVDYEADQEEARKALTDLINNELNVGFVLSGSRYRIIN